MTELQTRLSDTMRRHDVEAPTAAELAAFRPRAGISRRHPARLIAVVAVTALVVAGAGIVGLQWRHHQPQPTLPSPADAVLFVIGTPGARDGALVPIDAGAAGGGAGALRALFSYRSTGGRSNPWSGVSLDSVVHRGGLWRVDVDRAPSWVGNDPEAVMQSIAWTLSAATESADGILVTVQGAPLTTPQGMSTGAGYPSYGYLGPAASRLSWPQRTCGAGQYVAVSASHRWLMRPNVSGSRAGPAFARLPVGAALRVLPDGLCFRPATLAVSRTPVDREHPPMNTRALVWTPRRSGNYILQLEGSRCAVPGFTTDPSQVCLGGTGTFAGLWAAVVAH